MLTKKNYLGSENTPHINQGKEDTQGRSIVYPLHQKKNEKRRSMGIRRVTSNTPWLTLVMGVERSLLMSVFGASKFISIMDRVSMKLESSLGSLMRVLKTKPVKGLHSVRGVDKPAQT
eukprot:1139285-Pelagomonas_calceolata.AAC.2